MAIKGKFQKITPERYIRKVFYLNARTKLMLENQAKRLGALNDEYAKHYSKNKIGDAIMVDENSQAYADGYTSFVIAKIQPVIKQKSNGVEGAYSITFDLYGTYVGEGKENKTGKVIPTETIE